MAMVLQLAATGWNSVDNFESVADYDIRLLKPLTTIRRLCGCWTAKRRSALHRAAGFAEDGSYGRRLGDIEYREVPAVNQKFALVE